MLAIERVETAAHIEQYIVGQFLAGILGEEHGAEFLRFLPKRELCFVVLQLQDTHLLLLQLAVFLLHKALFVGIDTPADSEGYIAGKGADNQAIDHDSVPRRVPCAADRDIETAHYGRGAFVLGEDGLALVQHLHIQAIRARTQGSELTFRGVGKLREVLLGGP